MRWAARTGRFDVLAPLRAKGRYPLPAEESDAASAGAEQGAEQGGGSGVGTAERGEGEEAAEAAAAVGEAVAKAVHNPEKCAPYCPNKLEQLRKVRREKVLEADGWAGQTSGGAGADTLLPPCPCRTLLWPACLAPQGLQAWVGP